MTPAPGLRDVGENAVFEFGFFAPAAVAGRVGVAAVEEAGEAVADFDL